MMKSYFVISALLSVALLTSCSSNNHKSDDADGVETSQTLPTKDELRPRIMKAFKALPDHGIFRVNTKSCMTAEFYRAAQEAFDIPGNSPGQVGAEKDIQSWFTANGIQPTDHITSIAIDEIGADIVDARVWYVNNGEEKAHSLRLVNVEGQWLIGEMDGMHCRLKKYIEDRRAEYAGNGPRQLLEQLGIEPHSPIGEKFLTDVAKYKHRYGVK
jgi:hypothetical protein